MACLIPVLILPSATDRLTSEKQRYHANIKFLPTMGSMRWAVIDASAQILFHSVMILLFEIFKVFLLLLDADLYIFPRNTR